MPTTITAYKCNVCGAFYDHSITIGETTKSPSDLATECEGSHPGTLTCARAAQTFKQSDYSRKFVMPSKIKFTHNNKDYEYILVDGI